jgi:GT2 family glycosyltransferase
MAPDGIEPRLVSWYRIGVIVAMKKQNLTVSIVLPNWNGAHLMRKHLPHVLAASPGAEVIVSDDASSDDSLAALKGEFPSVRVVASSVRHGFAGNVNRGVAAAHGDIVVLLNTDVRPTKGFLVPLMKHFSDPQVFAVGCLEESHDLGGIVLRGRGEARWRRGFFIHTKGNVAGHDTAWVSGGSGAFRRSIWNILGGMDELFNPFYWEDIDLSYRARKAGYRLDFEPKARVGHFHEEGKIKSEYTASEVKRFAYRNQFIFIWKNLSDPAIWLTHCFWTPIRLLQAILRGDLPMLLGYAAALVRLPRILGARASQSKHWTQTDRSLFL